MIDIEKLIGKTITKINDLKVGSENVTFYTAEGQNYVMYHSQDCCESVSVEDVVGDVEDLIGSPVLRAEEVSFSNEVPPEIKGTDNDPEVIEAKKKAEQGENYYHYSDDSYTWTFYKLATIKGSLTIRWYGSSNGYYSESVYFEETK